MTGTSAIDHDDRPAGLRGVASGSIGDFEAVVPKISDADLCARTSIHLDPRDSAALRVAVEGDTHAGAVSEVHRVDDIDDRNDVPARPLPIHGEGGGEEPTHQQGSEATDDRSEDRVALDG